MIGVAGTIDTPLREALQLIREEDWAPHWLYSRWHKVSWCIEDALQQVTSGMQFGVAAYKLAYSLLSEAAGGDVVEWERQPNRRQREVEDLFEGVLGGT